MRRFVPVVLLCACASPPQGLRATPPGSGPGIVVDWDARPLPELPFPNDLATRADPMSPTGLRVNISIDAATTDLERQARRKINDLSGFGIYAPITVSFDAPLDLDDIALRHMYDADPMDDAFLVIDVTEGSPTYGERVLLDVGHGRFPGDVANQNAYFPFDALADTPSLLVDTHDEDSNDNGVLDPGEDLDDDGWLDVPNVWPEGGDPREDLLTWYERLTNTLIVRPALPMREQTTYAVVLTNRLVGLDGQPVRSPWEFVNHTRQTETLRPIEGLLPRYGLGVDDVAFAWTFTTGRVTGDLVDLRRSLEGQGPFSWLPAEIPPGVDAAHQLVDSDDANELLMPVERLVTLLEASGLVDGDAAEMLAEGYSYAESVVGGEYSTPYLLADADDGGGNEVDEWWKVDPIRGTIFHEERQVAFTCVIPKETEAYQQPFDVAMYGHGYGSTRIEGLMFAWAFARQGKATCLIDFPGHGPELFGEEREQIEGLLEAAGILPFLEHLETHVRFTDTDNNGRPDSGSHQWTADVFHTRDQVRQAVLDWMWLHAAFRDCGSGTMAADGDEVMSCDWDGNGVPDLGGPDAQYVMAGGSLGGINLGVAAAVLPEVSANVPIVGGGGLMDISTRAPTGGAVEAMHGKVMSPMFLGRPQGDGSLRITQYVNSYMDMRELGVATVPSPPVGGKVVVENLWNGEVREAHIRPDGSFRLSIPCDALDYYDKRVAAGIPDTGPEEGVTYSVPDNAGLGDELVVRVLDANGVEVAKFDTFDTDNTFQGVTYPAGSPLVAAASGLGRIRARPDTRRLVQTISMAIEPGDPIAYAPHWFKEPFPELGGRPTNVFLMPVPGDMVVAVNSEISLARAGGLIEMDEVDPRYGMTIDDYLIDRQVVRGLEEYGPYRCRDGSACLFDADNLDEDADDYDATSDAPLRITLTTEAGLSGVRLPYVSPRGAHGFGTPDSRLAFDINVFAINQIARYLETGGQELLDDRCLESNDCDWIPQGGAR